MRPVECLTTGTAVGPVFNRYHLGGPSNTSVRPALTLDRPAGSGQVRVLGEHAALRWRLRVGCHTDDISAAESWARWPAVTAEYDLPAVGAAAVEVRPPQHLTSI